VAALVGVPRQGALARGDSLNNYWLQAGMPFVSSLQSHLTSEGDPEIEVAEGCIHTWCPLSGFQPAASSLITVLADATLTVFGGNMGSKGEAGGIGHRPKCLRRKPRDEPGYYAAPLERQMFPR